MRILLISLGAWLVAGTSAWAQSTPVLTQIDTDLLDQGNEVDVLQFVEDRIFDQTDEFADNLDQFFKDTFQGQPPITGNDLPNPYATTLRSQAGYYRVTLTQPSR